MRDIITEKTEKRFLNTTLQLIRTNPKLSGNVKLVVDEKGDCFLSTFDRIPQLSSNSMKRYPYNVTKNYGENLAKFKKDAKIQKDQFFRLFESKTNLSVEQTFSKQRDDLYWKGCFFKDSSLYEERLSCLAPIWLRKEIPQYFVIFESNGPFSPNGLTQTITSPNDLQKWINDYRIVKSINLKSNTKIGKILNSIVENDRFSTDPLFISYKDNFIEYLGWDCDKGSLTSYIENGVRELTNIDHAILQREDQLIRGFSRGNLVVANLLNIEFLFDTKEFNSTNRYFGLFCDFDEIDNFIIDDQRAEDDKRNQYWESGLWNNKDCKDRIVENKDGVKVYYKLKSQPILNESDIETKRFWTILDSNSNFYSIKQPWKSVLELPNTIPVIDDEYLRIKNTELNIGNLCGFQESFSDEKITVPELTILPNVRIKLLKNPQDGDQIRIYITDTGNPNIDIHTITATNTLPLGTNLGNQFSNLGNLDNVVEAIINCVNYLYDTFYNFGFVAERNAQEEVIIKSTVDSTLRNGADIELWTSDFQPVFQVLENSYKPDTFTYTPSPVLTSTPVTNGQLIKCKFRGVSGSFPVVSESFIKRFQQSEIVNNSEFFIRNKTNLTQFIQLAFTGEEYYNKAFFAYDYEWKKKTGKDRIAFIDQRLLIPSSFKFTLYERIKNKVGLLSNYYLVDFDFDSYSSEYSKGISGDRENLLSFLNTSSSGTNQTTFPSSVSNLSILNEIYGNDSEFVTNGSEFVLNDFNINIEDIDNEYLRLQENFLKETAIISKVVPWITKWTKRGLNVRNTEYRFGGGPSFGVTNFSPSFKEFTSNPKFHTHEWFLMTGRPPYNTDDKIYMDYINGEWDSDLHLNDNDYFDNKTILYELNGQERELQFLSTKIKKSRTGFFETFFRGVTVRIKKKTTLNSIGFNVDGLKLDRGFDFEDYEFVAIITKGGPGFKIDITRNDQSKSIVFNLNVDFFDDILNGYLDAGLVLNYFMDRVQFYTNTSKFVYDGLANELQPSDINISGAILSWTISGGIYQFIGDRNDANGSDPNFAAEIFPNSDGSYNPILIQLGSDQLEISGILNVTSNTIEATSFVLNSSIPITVSSVVLGSSATYGFLIALLPFGDYTYPEGGFDFYRRLTDDISFANIAEKVNTGDPEISYRARLINGQIVENDFFIELIEPNVVVNNLYLQPQEDERPSTLRNEYGSIGSQLVNQKSLESYVFFRYNGFYSPKFKKLTKFSIEETEFNQLSNSIGRLHRFFDDQILHNLWYNKVSENSFDSILSGDINSNFQPLYPKIDEVCVEQANLNLFRSSWDYGILKESLNKSSTIDEWGIFAFPNLRLFLGNVLILARNEYLFDVFNDFDQTSENEPPLNLDLLDIKTSDTLYYQRLNNRVEFTVNVDKLLMESIFNEFQFLIPFLKESSELENRIITKFGSLNVFIKEIIIQELLQRYKVVNVNVFKKSVQLDEFDSLNQEFSDFNLSIPQSEKLSDFQLDNINSNFTFTSSNRRNFILNIPSKVGEGFIKSFSFTVTIR